MSPLGAPSAPADPAVMNSNLSSAAPAASATINSIPSLSLETQPFNTVPVASNVQPIRLRVSNRSESVNNLSDKGLTLSAATTQLSVGGYLKNLDQFASIPSMPLTIISNTNNQPGLEWPKRRLTSFNNIYNG